MANESRVALTPQGAAALIKKGLSVNVEAGAGELSNFTVRTFHLEHKLRHCHRQYGR